MRISVVIPAYNSAKFVGAALDSIAVQKRAPDEIIVVDDGSHDDTAQIVQSRRMSGLALIRQRNAGAAAARNAALEKSTGNWIAFLDADDLWTPDKLTIQAGLATECSDVDVWLGATEGVSLVPTPTTAGAFLADFSSRNFVQLGATFIRRSVFDRIGLFDPALKYGEDLDWLMRAQEAGMVIATHPETVLRYQRHSANLTNNASELRSGFLGVLKRSVDRRRLG